MISTKEHILYESFKLFLQKSYKEVTMKELVEKTGLSKGAFYHYFESKEHLFLEILNNFFASIMSFDFNRLQSHSLFQFYNDYSNQLNTMRFQFIGHDSKGDILTMNFFSLLFDAFKIFPEFRIEMEKYHKKELEAWIKAIKNARLAGEIKTALSDEQIAMIFIFSSDGLTMNLTMNGNLQNIEEDIKAIWDNFYLTIKA
jgi:TetR/AcrR family transcriptional regulator, transcriptional repressor for nem operon